MHFKMAYVHMPLECKYNSCDSVYSDGTMKS